MFPMQGTWSSILITELDSALVGQVLHAMQWSQKKKKSGAVSQSSNLFAKLKLASQKFINQCVFVQPGKNFV